MGTSLGAALTQRGIVGEEARAFAGFGTFFPLFAAVVVLVAPGALVRRGDRRRLCRLRASRPGLAALAREDRVITRLSTGVT